MEIIQNSEQKTREENVIYKHLETYQINWETQNMSREIPESKNREIEEREIILTFLKEILLSWRKTLIFLIEKVG